MNDAPPGGPFEISPRAFDRDVLGATEPVLVAFMAPWCGPCLRFEPVLAQLAEELRGRMRVVTINTDETDELPARYELQQIPTSLLMVRGNVVARVEGRASLEALREKIESALATEGDPS